MDAPVESAPLKVVDNRGKRLCPDVEIGQPVQGYLSPGHGDKVADDILGDDGCLADPTSANEHFVWTVGKLNGHLGIVQVGRRSQLNLGHLPG